MLSYGLAYKQERIEQHTAHAYPTSPCGAARWTYEAPGAEGWKPRPAHKRAGQEADEQRKRGEAEDEEAEKQSGAGPQPLDMCAQAVALSHWSTHLSRIYSNISSNCSTCTRKLLYTNYARIPYAYLLGDSMNLRAFLARAPLIPLRQSETRALLIIFDLVTLDYRKPRINSLPVRFVFYWFTECCFYLLAFIYLLLLFRAQSLSKTCTVRFWLQDPRNYSTRTIHMKQSRREGDRSEMRWGREEASRGKRAERDVHPRCTRK